ncbi:aminopeptidase P family protein [Flavitalea sp.]|nr:Xaa-Pro aminopeptidase [Flavitalea sp.]
MFDKETYINRRKQLQQKVNKGIVLLLGNQQSSMSYKDNWYPFRQDSSFLYFCGIDLADLILVIDIDNDREILFGNDATIDDVVWQGPLPALFELAEQSGIAQSEKLSRLKSYLQSARPSTVHYLPPYRPEHYDIIGDLLEIPHLQVESKKSVALIKAIVSLRSIKSEAEIAEIEAAVNITNQMQLAALSSAKAGDTEAHIAGQLQSIAIAGGGNLSFPTILTTRGETLHIHYTNNPIVPGKMLLCDCGAETERHYAGDLTRTFPVDQAFTQVQKEVYEIVLNAQQAAAAALKPGELYRNVHLLACEKLVDGLKQIGLMKGDSHEAVLNNAHTLFFQCGLGHMLGLDIHDMENLGEQYVGYDETITKSKEFGLKSLRLAKALEPGFVLTVEPGLYFIPALIDIWKAENKHISFINYDKLDQFRSFGGIRIEEDFVITETGARVLGETLPKGVSEIESFRKDILQTTPLIVPASRI